MVTARRSKQLLSLKHLHARASSSTVLPRVFCVGEDCTGALRLEMNDLVPGFLGLLFSLLGLQRLDKSKQSCAISLPFPSPQGYLAPDPIVLPLVVQFGHEGGCTGQPRWL